MLAVPAVLALGFTLLDVPLRPPHTFGHHRRARVPCATDDAIDVDGADATFEACIKMKVAELKAELDLRKVSYEGLFEKEEFARRLADARAAGRADPSLLDDFNKQSAESAFRADGESSAAAPDIAEAAEAVAGDGALPGGMSPDMLQSLMGNPELMALLRNPKMQEVMKKVMEGGPEGAQEYMADPEVREMLSKVQGLTGGAAS